MNLKGIAHVAWCVHTMDVNLADSLRFCAQNTSCEGNRGINRGRGWHLSTGAVAGMVGA